jgi:hypothetical protein
MPKSDRLALILESPRLDRLVPRLQPQVLHQVIQRRGLEDCADIVARATPEQLAHVFDLDVWRTDQPGGDDTFDADRFGVWLDVLMEAGPSAAAQKLMGANTAFVVAALAQHIRVFDRAAVTRTGYEVGGYLVEPKRDGAWGAISRLLVHLDAEEHDYFIQVMGGCRRLSNDGFELDELDDLLGDGDQELFEASTRRDKRREEQGYLSPAQARAFLQLARQLPRSDAGTRRNPVAAAYCILHEDVCGAAVDTLFAAVPAVANVPDALDVVMTHDMTAWAALAALCAEFPVVHAAMHPRGCHEIDPSAFEFISSTAQLTAIRHFLATLPERLL